MNRNDREFTFTVEGIGVFWALKESPVRMHFLDYNKRMAKEVGSMSELLHFQSFIQLHSNQKDPDYLEAVNQAQFLMDCENRLRMRDHITEMPPGFSLDIPDRATFEKVWAAFESAHSPFRPQNRSGAENTAKDTKSEDGQGEAEKSVVPNAS